MSQIIKSLRGGQITIPAPFREKLGIDSDSLLQLSLIEGELRIRPVKLSGITQDTSWLNELYDHFSAIRIKSKSMSDEEINQTIGKAVRAVRSKSK